MKEMMIAVAGMLGARYTRRQKTAFLGYAAGRAKEMGVRAVVGPGGKACRNCYLGNVEKASIILAAPYDTSARLLLPWAYHPLDPKKNLTRDSVDMAFRLALAAALVAVYYTAVLRQFLPRSDGVKWLAVAGMAAVAWLGFRLVSGLVNRKNYTRNSATVVVLLEYLRRHGGGEVAVALLDRSSSSLEGYRSLAEDLNGKAPCKRLIALDCICSGDQLLLHCTQPVAARLEKHKADTGSSRVVALPDIVAERTILHLFPHVMVLTGGERTGDETVVRGTRGPADCRINLEKMDRVLELLAKLTGTA